MLPKGGNNANAHVDFIPAESAFRVEYRDTSGSLHHLLDLRGCYSRLVHPLPNEAIHLRPHSAMAHVSCPILFRDLGSWCPASRSHSCSSASLRFTGSLLRLVGQSPASPLGVCLFTIPANRTKVCSGYAVASAAGFLFFGLNFGEEAGALTEVWVTRACIVQGLQQIWGGLHESTG